MGNLVRVSDVITDFLEQKKVETVFLLSGGMMMHLLDSISRSKTIRYVCTHHEQSGSMAAEAYARIKNSIGVCYATSGPGATNTITGIAGAWLDSSPVLFITGQSRTTLTVRGAKIDHLRMMGNFEVDIENIARPITKYIAVVDKPENILYELEKAIYLAEEGRPGPVLLDIPLDIQGAPVDPDKLRRFTPPVINKPDNAILFSQLAEKMNNSHRILIVGGHGIRVAGQVEAFRELVATCRIPVVTTQLANDLMPYENDLYIGKLGLRGDRAGNFAVQTADMIICIGTSLHVTTTGYEVNEFATQAYKVVIDLDDAVLEKNTSISQMQIRADVTEALAQIKERTAGKVYDRDKEWNTQIRDIKHEYSVIKEDNSSVDDLINTYEIVNTLSEVLTGDEIIVTDAGSLYYIVGQTFRVKKDQRVIVSGGLGAMGYALPAAIGACIADGSKKVICITGDGSMQTNVQELQTVHNYKLNCKIIVINNKGYASIRNSQASFQDGHIAASSIDTGVTFPDWKKIADAYTIPFRSVDQRSNLRIALQAMLQEHGPVFTEIVIPENVTMMPLVTSEKLPNGSFKSNKLHEMSPALNGIAMLDVKKYRES